MLKINMKTRFLFVLLTFGISQMLFAQKQEIMPYIDFLKKQQTDPVDYVFQLFEKHDIVILGERDHRDTTQYILIERILSDPRFIENVGNVFTELGVNNRNEWANRVLKGEYKTFQEFEIELRRLYQDLDWEILWEKYNFWMYLNSIYRINKDLPENKKINTYFCDVAYNWSDYQTPEERKSSYEKIYNSGGERDSIMGANFIKDYNQLLFDKNNTRKKALIIFNSPHSCQNYRLISGKLLNSAASYIFKEYPYKVANIMINWKGRETLIAGGKWDAAFKYLNNPSLGFDFFNSPFGECIFDYRAAPGAEDVTCKEVYTGFIFYKPIEEWVNAIGIPDIVDEKFLPEFKRRLFLNGSTWSITEVVKYYNNKRVVSVYNEEFPKDSADIFINYWLK
jgi:hypothetical protein